MTNALGAGATTVSSLTTSGDLLMTEDAAVLTHSAASGTSLAISSTNGYVSIGGSYVDVESVRFTDAKIGVSGDPDLITLTSGDVEIAGTLGAGATTVSSMLSTGDISMSSTTASLNHNGASGSLTISSDNGYVSVAGATGSYVDVESVRITDAKIGLSNDADILTLTSDGTTGSVAVAGTLSTSGAATLASASVAGSLAVTSGDATFSNKLSVGGAHSDGTKALYVNGDVYATGTVTSASDERFKRDVVPIAGALDAARSLTPATFRFRGESFPERRFPATSQAGVLAQDVEAVLPHLVSEDDAGFKGVAYERLGVYALAAVKELDALVDALATRVAALEEDARTRRN